MILDLIQEHPIAAGVLIAVVLAGAYLLDELHWKLKSDDELLNMTNLSDPKRVMVGLTQLRKRKIDISKSIHRVIPFLSSDSAIDRVTAKLIIKKHYPEDYLLIKDYSGTDSLEKCTNNLSQLLAKYEGSS